MIDLMVRIIMAEIESIETNSRRRQVWLEFSRSLQSPLCAVMQHSRECIPYTLYYLTMSAEPKLSLRRENENREFSLSLSCFVHRAAW